MAACVVPERATLLGLLAQLPLSGTGAILHKIFGFNGASG
jgi:hypothetical protein